MKQHKNGNGAINNKKVVFNASLGDNILRSETASVVAVGVYQVWRIAADTAVLRDGSKL